MLQVISLGSLSSDGFHRYHLRGTYALSNLLQELTIAQEHGESSAIINPSKLLENPLDRLRRVVPEVLWPGLTRRLDADVLEQALIDTKSHVDDKTNWFYVPHGAEAQRAYYSEIARQKPHLNLKIETLPPKISPEFYRSLIDKPGLLALDTEEIIDPSTGEKKTSAVPFIVPGGRFNEFFGWDSYFIALGLLINDRTDLVEGVVKNFIYEIQHYGLIPNANRSYFLLRSQPPFLTDLSLRLYRANGDKALLHRAIQASIKEYHSVWLVPERVDAETNLSRYRPGGVGIPMECEPQHFKWVIGPLAKKYGMTYRKFMDAYNAGEIDDPEFEEFLVHDRGVRESGHDTSTRLEHVCADLAIVDLNCLLYKYEVDIAEAIDTVFDGKFTIAPEFQLPTSEEDSRAATWRARAAARNQAVDKFLWNEEKGMYFDWHVKDRSQIAAESVTTLWPLWSGMASPAQAKKLVETALPRFECLGGLATSTPETCAGMEIDRHQWDYPYGWAPHQVMAWDGLARYGFKEEAARLAYRWLYLILKVFVDFNGAIVEKYNVENAHDPHRVQASYGNQGLVFEGYTREG